MIVTGNKPALLFLTSALNCLAVSEDDAWTNLCRKFRLVGMGAGEPMVATVNSCLKDRIQVFDAMEISYQWWTLMRAKFESHASGFNSDQMIWGMCVKYRVQMTARQAYGTLIAHTTLRYFVHYIFLNFLWSTCLGENIRHNRLHHEMSLLRAFQRGKMSNLSIQDRRVEKLSHARISTIWNEPGRKTRVVQFWVTFKTICN